MSKVIIKLSAKLLKKSPSFKSAKDHKCLLKSIEPTRHCHEKNADSNKKHQHHVGKVDHYTKLGSLHAKRGNYDQAREYHALARQHHDAAEKAKENFHYHSKKASKMRKKHIVIRKK